MASMLALSTAPTSLTYRINKAVGLIVITCVGEVDLAAILASQSEIRQHPDFDPDYSLLLDYTLADSSHVDAAAVKRVAAGTPFSARARRAFLVRDEVGYGLVRMFRAYSELAGRGDLVEVFYDRDEAMRWLAARTAGITPAR